MNSDETLGGYSSVHRGPPVFLAPDGVSYTAEVYVDAEREDDGRFGAALLFIRWSNATSRPDGHLETGYLARGETADEARAAVEEMTLGDVRQYLETLVEAAKGRQDW